MISIENLGLFKRFLNGPYFLKTDEGSLLHVQFNNQFSKGVVSSLCVMYIKIKLLCLVTYCKIPKINRALTVYFFQKAVLLDFFFGGGAYFRRGFLLEGILLFKMG